ncbi:MAG: LysR family transcriptional regulator [Elusimicrobia bacterium]|nr:LysR family transcriptional regulator [Elusimicrobiota bacterium]
MEIQQMRAFLAVASGGGYSRAAEAVHRTQPAVTASVKALERELGIALFERRGRRAALTPAGEALVAEAGPALDQWEGLADRLKERLSGQAQGMLRIGAGEAAVLYLLPDILKAFQKKHPKVRIVLHHQRAEETLRMLKSGELDLGVRSLTVVPAWAIYRPSRDYPRVTVCAKGHPFARGGTVKLSELARHPLLFPGSQSITRVFVEEALTKAGLAYQVGLEAGGWEAIKTYAAAGFGVAVVPELCLSKDDRRRLFVRSTGELFGRDSYGVVTRRGTALPPAARELIRLVDPGYPDLAPRGGKA